MVDVLQGTLTEIRVKAHELRDQFGDEARARALEWAAEQVEHALALRADEQLTLAEAALRSGYSPDHLARLIREGKLPNSGRAHAPRIRAADLPSRGVRKHGIVVNNGERSYDPVTDARTLGSRAKRNS